MRTDLYAKIYHMWLINKGTKVFLRNHKSVLENWNCTFYGRIALFIEQRELVDRFVSQINTGVMKVVL
jgi:hypothetical protein